MPRNRSEIAASSASIDLHDKLDVYRQQGVKENVVWRVLDKELNWFILREDRYDRLPPNSEGVYRSEIFPGLWVDSGALMALETHRLNK